MESIEIANSKDICQTNTLVSLYEAQVKDLEELLSIQFKVIFLQTQMMEKENTDITDIELAAVLFEPGSDKQLMDKLEEESFQIINQIDLRNQTIREFFKRMEPGLLN